MADVTLVEELRRYARNEAFDERPIPDLNSEAIDFRVAAESLAEHRRLTRKDLETLRILDRYHGRLVTTIEGVLLFGKDRGRHFPDVWIHVGRFGGIDRSRILDAAETVSCPPRAHLL